MFSKILIANRGEIACRVVATARRLGIDTVAVYSAADTEALHVAMADDAYRIGDAPARDSYLAADRIIAAAQASGAQAIHPGYGFLAENAEFAQACSDAGLVFIGPPVAAIRIMGSKRAAKQRLAQAGVPVVPGYHQQDQGDHTLVEAAADIGYPLLIKAVAGGGGRGMRLVTDAAGFPEALASARREAAGAFGDADMLLEKYLPGARHIEIQVFHDRHGNAVHLFERDCSLQRRRQKVVEEAPAATLSPQLRRRMGDCALAVARAVDYRGAGTVEFLLDAQGDFYFMEMNTRLQVEHPVTEMITGLDLVEWQLRVAAGEALPLAQDALAIDGHAVEARIYAEDPARDFAPSSGCLLHLRLPRRSPTLRVDTGFRQGDRVDIHYDSLLAKVITHGKDRSQALRRLVRALDVVEVAGVRTNVDFLRALLSRPEVAAGPVDTGFVDRHRHALLPGPMTIPDEVLAHACLHLLAHCRRRRRDRAARSADPHSPWHRMDGWRLNEDNRHIFEFRCNDVPIVITVHFRPWGYELDLPGRRMSARLVGRDRGRPAIELNGHRSRALVIAQARSVEVYYRGQGFRLQLHDPLSDAEDHQPGHDRVIAPVPGRVASIHVTPGTPVLRGEALLTIEAMKMEHVLSAPCDATVAQVHCSTGDLIEENTELISLDT
jgi:3-methylcrotonyl-CoA carboxylase alpha subunit